MNAAGKTVDKTYLSIDTAEDRGFIHRDYIAHCLRWTHVIKRLYERKTWQTARILDVGCGRELPFAKTLYSSKLIPKAYFGVDVGPVNDEDFAKLKGDMAERSHIHENTNFLEMLEPELCIAGDPLQSLPNIVTCFEVLEHVEPKMMIDMLKHMQRLTTEDARFFISTPCWNRTDCAANHVNEMLYEALGSTFERHGFIIENVYGTFASIRDYEHLLDAKNNDMGNFRQLFDSLREYYDTNFLSCIFAPIFPAQSRNCLWELRKAQAKDDGKYKSFPFIETIKKPWSSSARREDMAL